MPSLLSYHTNRAVAQADINGGFRPAAAGVALRGAALRAGRGAGVQPRAEPRWSRRIRSTVCIGCVPAGPRRPCCWTASAAPRRRWRSSCSRPTGRRRSIPSRPGAPSASARGPGARGDGRRVRRPRVVPQPRGQRDRVRADRRGGPATDRRSRRDHARGLHRGVLRPSPLGRGGAGRAVAQRRAGPHAATWWTSTSCGSKRRRRSTRVSLRRDKAAWMVRSWSSRARAPAWARNSRALWAPPGASRCWRARRAERLEALDAGDRQRGSRRLRRHRRGRPERLIDGVIERHGRLDGLVNNAGSGAHRPRAAHVARDVREACSIST